MKKELNGSQTTLSSLGTKSVSQDSMNDLSPKNNSNNRMVTNNNTFQSVNLSLCANIRRAYSTLIRITQLEQQLFESLFRINKTTINNSINESINTNISIDESTEVLSIIQNICNTTNDCLRPLIIHESNVDELCKVINILAEDVRSQITAMNSSLSINIINSLMLALEYSISDTQERLSYCVEVKLRQDIQLFNPLPSHLAYPELLETTQLQHETAQKQNEIDRKQFEIDQKQQENDSKQRKIAQLSTETNETTQLQSESTDLQLETIQLQIETSSTQYITTNQEDISITWYPTLKSSLALLSKLYGILDMLIFEDFAARCIHICLNTLQKASQLIHKRTGMFVYFIFLSFQSFIFIINCFFIKIGVLLHSNLFLLRHLLILREQLVPFEIKLKSNSNLMKKLDFRPTKLAITNTFMNNNNNNPTTNLLRFDYSNTLIKWARVSYIYLNYFRFHFIALFTVIMYDYYENNV